MPNTIASPYSIQVASESTYVLLNTELVVDSYLNALEFYSISGGYLGDDVCL